MNPQKRPVSVMGSVAVQFLVMATDPNSSSIKKRTETKHRGVYEKITGSGIWWVRYYDADGQKHREKVGRKSDAIKLYQKRKSDIRAGAKLPTNLRQSGEKLSVILGDALDWYKSHRPKALKHATTHVAALAADLGDKLAANLKPEDVDTWLASHEGWSPATMNRHKATLSKALQLAVISGKLDRNVARLVPARRENNARIRWLRDDEEKRLVDEIKKTVPDQLQAFTVALHTGMRKSEQFSLEWDEIDFKRRKIFLDKTKNGTNREVPMSKTCHQAFCDLWKIRKQRIKEKKPVNQFVFQSGYFTTQRLQNPRFWFEAAVKEAEIKDFHWHDLRHTFCSRLVMRGVDLRTVMELAGHKSITITTRYAHLAPEHNIAAIETLDAPIKGKKK